MNITLAVIGFVFLGAAVIGGGLKAAGIEVPALTKSRQQVLLSIIGVLALVAAVADPWLTAQASSPRVVISTSTSISPSRASSSSPARSSDTAPPQSPPVQSKSSESQQPSSLPNLPAHPTCFDATFNSIPSSRIVVVQNNSGSWTQVGPEYRGNLSSVGGVYGFLLIDYGHQAAIRINIDSVDQQFSIEKALDDNCQTIQMTPSSGSLGTSISFPLDVVSEIVNFRTETGNGRYWLEIAF